MNLDIQLKRLLSKVLKGRPQFLLAAYSEMPEDREKLGKELQSRKEIVIEGLEILSLSILQNMRKYVLGRMPRVWLDNSWLNLRFGMWLVDPISYQQIWLQLGFKATKMGQNEGKPLDFWHSVGKHRHMLSFKKRKNGPQRQFSNQDREKLPLPQKAQRGQAWGAGPSPSKFSFSVSLSF